MKKIILILLLLINVLYSQDSKKYVSTFGQKIDIVDEVQKSNQITLYEITNNNQKNILLSSIYNFTKKDSDGHNLLFNFFAMQLNNTNYETTICYVLVSTLTNDLEINQPYYYKGSNELIFEVNKGKYHDQHYVYIRVYKVKADEDVYDKYILENGNKIKLKAVKLK